jgi:hypothetical protein
MSDLTMKVAPGAFQVEHESLQNFKLFQMKSPPPKLFDQEDAKLMFEANLLYRTARQRRKLLVPFMLRKQAMLEIESKPENTWRAKEEREEKERQYRQREMERFLNDAAKSHATVPPKVQNTGATDASFTASFTEKGLRALALLPPIRRSQAASNTDSPHTQDAAPIEQTKRVESRPEARHDPHTLRLVAALLRRLELSHDRSPTPVASPHPTPPRASSGTSSPAPPSSVPSSAGAPRPRRGTLLMARCRAS